MQAKQSRTRSETVNSREASPQTCKSEVFEKGLKTKHVRAAPQMNRGKQGPSTAEGNCSQRSAACQQTGFAGTTAIPSDAG